METTSRDLQGPDASRGDARADGEVFWRFGPFVIREWQRRLEASGRTVRLGPRSFDLLLMLVKRAGEFVGKEELLSTVWAGVIVEDASVRVHVSLVRKALGEPGEGDGCEEWISNVPLRGYRFNGKVTRERIVTRHETGTAAGPPFMRLPSRLTRLVGRDDDVDGIVSSIVQHRLVTVVGPGGIGKTSVAICAAKRYHAETGAQVGFVDLSPLISPDHVQGTLARALGIAADLPDTLEAIVQSLAGRDVLLLVDNCEHVVEPLARTLSLLLSDLPGLRVLATSRETLRLLGECVFRVPALAVPDAAQSSLSQIVRSPSVELLLARARAAGADDFREEEGRFLAKISRQLEGVPLAIELVAARLGAQSAKDLASRLDDHVRLLSIGNRGATGRHRSLAAALDWSMALLDAHEARFLRALSVFRGAFDVESALAIAPAGLAPDVAFDALASLVDKSLVMFDASEHVAAYRLLDTTRAHAAALAAESGERADYLRRHAAHMLDTMKAATAELPSLSERAWGERYAHRLDDVRYAFENCLSDLAGVPTAAALITASAPLWFHVSEVAEYRDRVAAALSAIERREDRDVKAETWLTTALIVALLHTDGSNRALDLLCDRAIAGAQAAKVRVLELQAHWGRCTHDMFRGAYADALRHSGVLLGVVQSWSDLAALNLAHRISAMANHFCGAFDVSRRHSDASLRMSEGAGRTRANMVGVDPVVAAKALLARTLWIQGHTAEALATATDAIARAQENEHATSLCAALYGGCPVALWSEALDLADGWIRLMREESRRRGLVGWLRYADWYHEGLLAASGDPVAHVCRVSERLPGYDAPHREMLATFRAEWVDEGLLERVRAGEGLWCAAEVWRGIGFHHERCGSAGDAEACYLQAFDIARRQGATAWARRAAFSLAGLWNGQGKPWQARQVISEACAGAVDDDDRMLARLRDLRERMP